MKTRLSAIVFLLVCSATFGQSNCNPKDFKKLFSLSKQPALTDAEFSIGLKLFKKLEAGKCSDYSTKNPKGQNSVIAPLTAIFGDICLKANSRRAISEYIGYLQRHHGSAEEQLSFSFEKLFVKRPADVFALVGNDADLEGDLVWGFVNNHGGLTAKNYKIMFYRVNPNAKAIYPSCKNQVDHLLNAIGAQLKGR
jgi:hypothetical protein